jgi:hypothetical protein
VEELRDCINILKNFGFTKRAKGTMADMVLSWMQLEIIEDVCGWCPRDQAGAPALGEPANSRHPAMIDKAVPI